MELLRRDRLEFVYEVIDQYGVFGIQARTAALEQRVFDGGHRWVGQVREEAPRRRPTLDNGLDRTPVRAALYDATDAKVVEFEFSSRFRARLGVTDGSGRPVGTFEVSPWRRRVAIHDCSGERVGSVAPTDSFDLTIEDASGADVGWIAGWRGRCRREGIVVRLNLRERWALASAAPDRHFLAITADIPPDLRLMMLAASAGIHLLFPPSDGDGD